MKIVFTGGGTGGHILPILAIVRELKKISCQQIPSKPLFLYYLGPKNKLFLPLLKKEGVKVHSIFCGKIRRYFNLFSFFQNLFDIFFKIPFGFFQAFFKLFFLAPDVIFSKGGYGSLPVVISGFLLQIPIILHESDIRAGFVNKFASKFAIEIFVSFPQTKGFPKDKMLVVGHPIREEILKGDPKEGKIKFNLTEKKPVILFLGGSQGATRINEILLNILPEWLKFFEILHVTGIKNLKQVKKEAKVLLTKENEKYYHPIGFLDEKSLSLAFSVSHLIISRAGAGSIFEIAALGKPSILLPLPEAAQNHQAENAYAFAKNKACFVLEEANLTPHFLLERARYILGHPELYKKMAQAAREFARPKAARIIAEYLLAYLSD